VSDSDLHFPCVHAPIRFEGWQFKDFDQDTEAQRAMLAAAQRLVDGEIDNLVLIGGPGCGKSTILAIAANEIADRLNQKAAAAYAAAQAADAAGDQITALNYRQAMLREERLADRQCPRWVNVGRLIVDLKAEMSESPGLLVLDDVGRERISEWSAEILYALISQRYDDKHSTALSSNVTASTMADRGYGAILSRLVERGIILEIDAPDYRFRLRAGE
jgi:DNA replication protein DnaC